MQAILDRFLESGKSLATAESCTGGLLAGKFTELPGSSKIFMGGVVAYANALKTKLLSVPERVLKEHGAVSREVVELMAKNVRDLASADISVAITGIAGPAGGSSDKPVGTVWLAFSGRRQTICERLQLTGSRDEIRRQIVEAAVEKLLSYFDDL